MTRLILCLFVLLSLPCFAATYFVSNSATNGYVVGVDTNAGTAKGTAVLTLTQAHTLAADGDTIQVNCGTYPTGTNPANPFAISKAITLTPETASCVIIQQPNAGDIALDLVHNAGGTINIGAVIIDGTGVGTTGVRVKDAGANPVYTVIMTGTTVRNFVGQMINATAPSRVNFTFQNGVISQPQNPGGIAIDFHPAFNTSWASGSVNILNNAISVLASNAATLTPVVFIASPGATTSMTVNFSGNAVTTTVTSTLLSSLYTASVQVNNIPNAQINNNTVNITEAANYTGTGGAIDGIRVYTQLFFALTNNSNTPTITGNSVTNTSTNAAHGILAGEDSSLTTTAGHNMTNNPVIVGNAVRGQPGSVAIHAVFIGNSTGGTVHDNTVINALICFIAKGQTGGNFFNNHGARCSGQGLRSKASSGINFMANDITFVPGQAMAVSGSYGMLADDDTVTTTVSTGVVFSGNTIRANALPTAFISSVGVGSTATFDGNSYYLITGTQQFSYQGTAYSSVSTWQSAHELNLYYQPSGTVGTVF